MQEQNLRFVGSIEAGIERKYTMRIPKIGKKQYTYCS
jgi:hypothetical protein